MDSVNIRTPAVAGLFYPAGRDDCARTIAALLHDNPDHAPAPKVLVLPHAGWIYSGPVAAHGYNLLAAVRQRIRRVILLGPSHRVAFAGMAVPASDAFRTPLGDVPVDAAARTQAQALPGVIVSDEAHRREHSLEVHLPFLQGVLDAFTLLPVVVGDAPAGAVAQLLQTLWGGEETLVVVSSDLSHYLPYETAQRIDHDTCARILRQDTHLHGEQACGCRVLNGLNIFAAQHPLTLRLLDVRNSGDTAGDRDRVVGYAAIAGYESP